MRKIGGILLLLALLAACAAPACGEIGFAEVNRDGVNFRKAPGGEFIARFDAPKSVYVFEEKQVKGQLWCHAYTNIGKDNRAVWIRGDMLRFLSDEFYDVVSVQGNSHYITGLRRDGTVAILGNDMPHSPCIDTVRTWRNVQQVTSSICAVYALDRSDRLLTVGRSSVYTTDHAAKLCGAQPILLDADGYILPGTAYGDEWFRYHFPEAARSVRFADVAECEREVEAGLTMDGRIVGFNGNEERMREFDHAPYTAVSMYFYHLAALRADGRVDVVVRANCYEAQADRNACRVEDWENVVQVAAGCYHTLGLKRDGTVYYAGSDARQRAQVEGWTDVVQVAAGNGYSIALMADGSVAMAGAYTSYER